MAVEYVCDHCGKRETARAISEKAEEKPGWWKPSSAWLERFEGKKIQTACSKECATEVAKALGIDIPIQMTT